MFSGTIPRMHIFYLLEFRFRSFLMDFLIFSGLNLVIFYFPLDNDETRSVCSLIGYLAVSERFLIKINKKKKRFFTNCFIFLKG